MVCPAEMPVFLERNESKDLCRMVSVTHSGLTLRLALLDVLSEFELLLQFVGIGRFGVF
jgi:hypothetical protein